MPDRRSDVLVTTEWVAQRLQSDAFRLVEVDVDVTAYREGHIPGAVGWNWTTELQDRLRRDILSPEAFAQLMRRCGIARDDLVVLYGDNHNWFAAYALWQMRLYGHQRLALMDGGRQKWADEGRPLTADVSLGAGLSDYPAVSLDTSLRALQPEVSMALRSGDTALIDVRSPAEFTGEILAPPGLSETAQRGGHIPGAVNVPWSKVVAPDGTFLPERALRALYETLGVTEDKDIITYCRIGERSSHTWFVLREILGFSRVRNYDGSWTEWGSMVGTPIER